MTTSFIRAQPLAAMTAALPPIQAGTTHLAVIYDEAEDASRSSFAGVIGGIEETSGIQVIRDSLPGSWHPGAFMATDSDIDYQGNAPRPRPSST